MASILFLSTASYADQGGKLCLSLFSDPVPTLSFILVDDAHEEELRQRKAFDEFTGTEANANRAFRSVIRISSITDKAERLRRENNSEDQQVDIVERETIERIKIRLASTDSKTEKQLIAEIEPILSTIELAYLKVRRNREDIETLRYAIEKKWIGSTLGKAKILRLDFQNWWALRLASEDLDLYEYLRSYLEEKAKSSNDNVIERDKAILVLKECGAKALLSIYGRAARIEYHGRPALSSMMTFFEREEIVLMKQMSRIVRQERMVQATRIAAIFFEGLGQGIAESKLPEHLKRAFLWVNSYNYPYLLFDTSQRKLVEVFGKDENANQLPDVFETEILAEHGSGPTALQKKLLDDVMKETANSDGRFIKAVATLGIYSRLWTVIKRTCENLKDTHPTYKYFLSQIAEAEKFGEKTGQLPTRISTWRERILTVFTRYMGVVGVPVGLYKLYGYLQTTAVPDSVKSFVIENAELINNLSTNIPQ